MTLCKKVNTVLEVLKLGARVERMVSGGRGSQEIGDKLQSKGENMTRGKEFPTPGND